jgi:hypothetical protein
MPKKITKNNFFGISTPSDEKSTTRIRIRNPMYEFKDPSPSQIVTDPEQNCSVGGSVVDPDPHVFSLPDPDSLVRGIDLDPDPSLFLPILTQNLSKN